VAEAVAGGALDGAKEVVVPQPAIGEDAIELAHHRRLGEDGQLARGTRVASRTPASASP
jgi:hypothetical protein